MTNKNASFVLEPEAVAQITPYGVSYPAHGIAKTADEAVGVADGIGYPVVMKIVSKDAPHKSDVGGVVAGLADADGVRSGYQKIMDSVTSALPDADISGVLICKQAPEGVEVIIGATEDPIFGMTIMFGLGGIFTEVLKDVSFRIAPLEQIDAEEMIREIKGYPMLTGVRGQEPCDLDSLADLLVGVSKFVADRPDITELDLNPVRAYPEGVQVLDVRIIKKS
ncbi:MAG: acetate--CoA ligase family protein [Deltaproteobacteria bacterium]|nr:acetate--CoA ligase family protein [Deltaproteobacteria bacterium]